MFWQRYSTPKASYFYLELGLQLLRRNQLTRYVKRVKPHQSNEVATPLWNFPKTKTFTCMEFFKSQSIPAINLIHCNSCF